MLKLPFTLASALLSVAISATFAQERPSWEEAAAKLQAATMTLRVLPAEARKSNEDATEDPLAKRVTVCSGVSLKGGLVVTSVRPASVGRIRITLPGGEQAEARICVLDHYSGLSLLDSDRRGVPHLALAEDVPKVGAWVMAAAAWGVEKPVVSIGILSATDRSTRGANFPPLLQCDLRVAETSSGGPIVNRQGELIGLVVAAEPPGKHQGWTYVVPVSHVRRLIRAREQAGSGPGKIIVLSRKRPVVGCVLNQGSEPGTVVVGRVTQGGPADKSGIRVGDRILAVEGIKIRSVYQAVSPVLARQPGDKISYRVRQGNEEKDIEVTLGGGVEVPAGQATSAARILYPRLEIEQIGPRRFAVNNAMNLSDDGLPPRSGAGQPDRTELLEKAISRYSNFIQEELRRQEAERAETEELVRSLKARIEDLEREMQESAR